MEVSLIMRLAIDAFLQWIDQCDGELRLPVQFAQDWRSTQAFRDEQEIAVHKGMAAAVDDALHTEISLIASDPELKVGERLAKVRAIFIAWVAKNPDKAADIYRQPLAL